MNRRNFLRSLVGGVATAAAVRTFPFRVYSFPSEPVGRWVAYNFKFLVTLPPSPEKINLLRKNLLDFTNGSQSGIDYVNRFHEIVRKPYDRAAQNRILLV